MRLPLVIAVFLGFQVGKQQSAGPSGPLAVVTVDQVTPEIQKQLDESQAALRQAETARDSFQAERQSLREKISHLESELVALLAAPEANSDDIETLESQLETVVSERDDLARQVVALSNELQKIRQVENERQAILQAPEGKRVVINPEAAPAAVAVDNSGGSLQDGLQAYQNRDFEAAARIWVRPRRAGRGPGPVLSRWSLPRRRRRAQGHHPGLCLAQALQCLGFQLRQRATTKRPARHDAGPASLRRTDSAKQELGL